MSPIVQLIYLFSDAACIVASLLIGIYLRFDFFQSLHTDYLAILLPFSIPCAWLIFYLAGLYNRNLRYYSINDMMALFVAVSFVSFLKMAFIYFHQKVYYSRGILLLDWMMNCFFIGGTRILPRTLYEALGLESLRFLLHSRDEAPSKRVLIFGAGQAGESVAREIRRNQFLHLRIVGFVDDDPRKQGQYIHGIKVLGDRSSLNRVISRKRIEEVIIAIPSAPGQVIREIMKLCSDTEVRFKTIPGLQDMLDGKLAGLQLRDVAIEDLLRRPSVQIDIDEIAAYVKNKVILVTGAGGSIGSEICRQILPFSPQRLLLLGQGENSIYTIHQELARVFFPFADRLVPLIGNVQDRDRLERIFHEYCVQIVFHAAAHKHVPLMESNPCEAVKNNVLGTKNLVETAHRHQTERFVLISTDKAVNPTSVMGATKRLAEMVMKAQAQNSSTRFCAVRFGNVLGSRGSVIPLFKKQIEAGGPVTITHPEMIRYFMTIPEASKLVVQAGAFGQGGEVFVLDMGEPVKILDLARDLIRLSGLEEGRDIKIEFSGIRPGEKLYEELLTQEEGTTATKHAKISVAPPEKITPDTLERQLADLFGHARANASDQVLQDIGTVVKSFGPEKSRGPK
jgi:FlaA1/EpsC-like NDP-sugar epimerase